MQRALIVAMGVVLVGCGSYFAPNRNISDRLDDSVVPGTWQLTKRSLQLLTREGLQFNSAHRYAITFRPDHTCDFASVRHWFDKPEYLAVPCTWLLEHDTPGDSNVRKVNALRLQLPTRDGPYTQYLNFAREDGRLLMWEYLGDPDLWEFVEYYKTEAAGS